MAEVITAAPAKIVTINRRPRITYEVDGVKLPGVTSILGEFSPPNLKWWAYKLGKEGRDIKKEMQESQDIGTLFHGAVEHTLKGNAWKAGEELAYCFPQVAKMGLCFDRAWSHIGVRSVLCQEQSIPSVIMGFGGTIDIVADCSGRPTIIDLKTSSSIWPEMYAQIAAYRLLYSGHTGIHKKDIDGIIINCDKMGFTEVAYITPKQMKAGEILFTSLFKAHKALKTLQK